MSESSNRSEYSDECDIGNSDALLVDLTNKAVNSAVRLLLITLLPCADIADPATRAEIGFHQGKDFKSFPWWKPITALVAGAAVSAHGSNVVNNKRTAELTALLVRSTNSASELPISKSPEYSDLLEDSDNQWLTNLFGDRIVSLIFL